MKTAIASLVAVLVLLVSFQNCQQPPHPDEINGKNVLASGVISKVDLNEERVKNVNFIFEDQTIVNRAGQDYTVKYNKTLQVDLTSGVIVQTSDLDAGSNQYCLTEDLRVELVSILKSSQVCKSGVKQQSGQVCAQSIKLAYAELLTDREEFQLGYATDACGSNSIDLCEGQSNLLKGYIQALKNQYSQLSCN